MTGLIVNKKNNIDRRYYKATRAMAYKLYSEGFFVIDGLEGNKNQLEGRFSFINQIEKYNNNSSYDKHDFWHLSSKEKQFQAFLFYKYFIANDKPLVITEGKTDIAYIKAALMGCNSDYSNLLSQSVDSKMEFQISFLKRTKRLNYFLGINQQGADTMKNVYNLYVKNGYSNYFHKVRKSVPEKPVILIFDNELSNKNKPLKHFIDHVKLNSEQVDDLQNKGYVNVVDNLYLLTHPLVKDKKECEIEDLFDDITLAHKISDKSFTRKGKYDTDKFYGKEIFSKYILTNYKHVDFKEFKPFLDGLNEIICTYNAKLKYDNPTKEKAPAKIS